MKHLSIYIYLVYPSIYLSIYLSYLSYLSIYQYIYLSIFIYLSYLSSSIYLSIHHSILEVYVLFDNKLPLKKCINGMKLYIYIVFSSYLSINLSIWLSIHLSMYPKNISINPFYLPCRVSKQLPARGGPTRPPAPPPTGSAPRPPTPQSRAPS